MNAMSQPESMIILGNGYSAHLAAIALAPVVPLVALIGPAQKFATSFGPEALIGQHAHSHIFLPRLGKELQRIDPALIADFERKGLRYVPGSKRLTNDAPAECTRMFATRWQFDKAVHDVFRERVDVFEQDAIVDGVEVDGRVIKAIKLADGTSIPVDDNTFVLDAMGAQSPVMTPLIEKCDDVQEHSSDVVYVTQFFRLNVTSQHDLPDPLIDCPHDFGIAHLMLYPAQEGWFTVTAAVASQDRELVKRLRNQENFIQFCQQHPHVAQWLEAADPVGPCRIYVNPRNRWNTAVFNGHRAPENYLAVGDALASTVPTLGANCSFAATHIRVVRDLVQNPPVDLHKAFYDDIHLEQYGFFESAVNSKRPPRAFVAYEDAPQNRFSKRLKNRLRRAFGLDRGRISRQLAASSSL